MHTHTQTTWQQQWKRTISSKQEKEKKPEAKTKYLKRDKGIAHVLSLSARIRCHSKFTENVFHIFVCLQVHFVWNVCFEKIYTYNAFWYVWEPLFGQCAGTCDRTWNTFGFKQRDMISWFSVSLSIYLFVANFRIRVCSNPQLIAPASPPAVSCSHVCRILYFYASPVWIELTFLLFSYGWKLSIFDVSLCATSILSTSTRNGQGFKENIYCFCSFKAESLAHVISNWYLFSF